MARSFVRASSEYLAIGTPVLAAFPITFACWFNVDNTLDQSLISIGDIDTAEDYLELRLRDPADTDVLAIHRNASTLYAKTTASYTVDTWHHGCAVFAATNDRRVYLNGGNKGTNATDQTFPDNVDTTTIGRRAGTTTIYVSGGIAEAGIWNVALTDAEVAILAATYSPLFVKPQNLVAYYRLIRDEDQDRVGGYDMTAYNTPTISAHPPIIYPSPPHIIHVTAAPPPTAAALPILADQAIHSLVFGGVTIR
jgi:hypothetical protein